MTQKITIQPVTRIEGHAKITIYVNDDGKVDNAYFHVDQFRGFEKFSEGRPFYEMPIITPRICGICPVSHHLAAAKACDAIISAQIPRPAKLLRELMHMGQVIQSHSMHFFELAGPDLILGWDADPKIRNVVGLIEANPELAIKAVKLRKFGQEVIAKLGGRRIHPNYAVPGGVNNTLSIQDRDELLRDIDTMIPYIQEGVALAKDWIEKNRTMVEEFGVFSTGYMGLVNEDGGLELYDGKVKLIGKDGNLLELFDRSEYLNYIGEHVEDWSYLKFPFYKKLGWPEGVYRVGPLARLNVATKINTPLAQEEFKNFKSINGGKPVEGSLYYHYARLIEDLYAAEMAKELLLDQDILSDDILVTTDKILPEGVGVIEAPRGTLFHHYWVDERGSITRANLIVATGHNNWAMSKGVEEVAKRYVDGKNITEGMLNRVEGLIRCYDPCLSCSTHAVGKMPMVIDIVSKSTGEVIKSIKRE
ncbi:MAG TPA: Ni/Fe hydrogenase subunit alpha [bacterium]|nr:Ni/Fe hydrogenase subunit alpha [bacterium]